MNHPVSIDFVATPQPSSRARKDDLRYDVFADIPDSILSSNLFP